MDLVQAPVEQDRHHGQLDEGAQPARRGQATEQSVDEHATAERADHLQ